jgi:hypothetical protein
MLACPANHRLHTSQIWIPAAPADIVRVAYCVSEARFLAANFTNECHRYLAPNFKFSNETNFHAIRDCPMQEAICPHGGVALPFEGISSHFLNGAIS